MTLAGQLLLVLGTAITAIATVALLRARSTGSRIHIMSIGVIAGLIPALLGGALYTAEAAVVARVVAACIVLFFAAPYLGQALILRAVVNGDIPSPHAGAPGRMTVGDGEAEPTSDDETEVPA